jgi:prepilin-type N-terminal cleavage/methylation domain-containing protein
VGYPTVAGLTLIEMLVVVAVIAILVTMVIGIAARIDNQSKIQLTKNTFALLDDALKEFQDYGYEYKDPCYAELYFPLDCNDYTVTKLETIINPALGTTGAVTITPASAHDKKYSGSEMLYFFLNMVPECRKTLDKIDKSLITRKGSDGQDMTITIGSKDYPLFRFIDPWGTTLMYDYYREELRPATWKDNKRAFPVITSAGPDKDPNTVADNITSR